MSAPERISVGDNGGQRPPASAERDRAAEPRIYVASLSDYNNGDLIGEWMNPAQDLSDLRDQVQAMLRRSKQPGAAEYAIHDYEGFGSHVAVGEYTSLERVHLLSRGIQANGQSFAAWWGYTEPTSLDEVELLTDFARVYLGTWQTIEDYAEQRLDDMGAVHVAQQVPTWLQSYLSLDIEGYAQDLVLNGEIITMSDPTGVHVFEGNAG